jgi:septation ring formation regulator EzrA
MKFFLQNTLMEDIFVMTAIIQKKFPELYENLRETPLFLSEKRKDIGTVDFEHYLDSLKTQLKTFEKRALKPETGRIQ